MFNVFAYREIDQTDRIDPIYGTLTGSGMKVFSDAVGIKEIFVRSSWVGGGLDNLKLMNTPPNTLAGTNVRATLSNGSVDYAAIEVPGNTFILEQDSGDPAPVDMAACAPSRPAPPYYVIETNALAASFGVPAASGLCVEYLSTCNETNLSLLSYTQVGLQCAPPPCGCLCTSPVFEWSDVTTSIDTGNNIICGDTGVAPFNVPGSAFVVAEPISDTDGDGVTNVTDCNDNDPAILPGASEICDGKDNNCNGQVDEGLPSTDADGDGHYLPGSCTSPADDCDDSNPAVHPNATEICDGLDNNCNAQVDEGLFTDNDGDGHFGPDSCLGPQDDCDDNNPLIWDCNTPVQPDPFTFDDPSGVTVTLPNVTSGGDSSIVATVCSDPLPEGLGVTANALCATIQTTAQFSGLAEVCIPYEDNGTCSLTSAQACTSDAVCPAGENCFDPNEPFLQMVRCPDGDPASCEVLAKSSQDTVNNILCANTDQFSQFAVGQLLDTDNDFTPDLLDNCPQVSNFFQTDGEVDSGGNPVPDGVGDVCDNCSAVPNTNQLDTDSDGYGNMCDGDLNNDGATNTLDLNLYKQAHRTSVGNPNYNADADFNGDGLINTLDLNIYKGLHRQPPGPSCCGAF